jgi:mutual gliding-motility protein MglA
MLMNWKQRELNLKIVYYGPALSGKTTNLEQIYARVNPKHRGELVALKTSEDRTLFFDFLQLELDKIGSFTLRVSLYTVPGQTYYEASRRLVLRGADGIVFVADSTPGRLAANLMVWKNMHTHLTELNLPLTKIPIIVQFNKQDISGALTPQFIGKVLRLNGLPTFSAVAKHGDGIFPTLQAAIRNTVKQVQHEVAI